jgi:hypothetical protein
MHETCSAMAGAVLSTSIQLLMFAGGDVQCSWFAEVSVRIGVGRLSMC